MVISKDGKRKRRDSPIIESSPEIPKRTKVQAQRKFAQGQSAPSSTAYSSVIASSSAATAAANSNSQPGTPVRENREPPPELITHKRPRTEDFLTFLCFRGTSVLPSHLDFLNQNKNPNTKKENESTTSTTVVENNDESETNGNTINVAKASTSKESDESLTANYNKDKLAAPGADDKIQKPPDIMPFAVRKRADQVCKATTKLKEKAKETNRRSLRTRGGKAGATTDQTDSQENGGDEDVKDEEKKTPNAKTVKKSVENVVTEVKPNKRKTTSVKATKTVAGATKEIKVNENKKNVESTSTATSKNVSETEEDRKTPSEKGKATTRQGKPKSRLASSPPLIPSPQPGGRMTRQRAFFEPVKPLSKASEEEVMQEDSKKSETVDFSSDDEQPLAKAIKLSKRTSRSPKKSIKGKKKVGKEEENHSPESTEMKKSTTTSVSPSPTQKRNKSRSKVNEKPSPVEEQQKEKSPDVLPEKSNKNNKKSKSQDIDSRAESISRKSDTSSKLSSNKQTRKVSNVTKQAKKGQKRSNTNTTVIDRESENSSPKRKTKSKKSTLNSSQKSQSQTDLSENEHRNTTTNARPSRKTKEAATIYMELIGQKLNLDDFDDDDSSIDSFPELPNAKKTQKMENELKKNINRPQKQTKASITASKKKEKDTLPKNDNAAAKNFAAAKNNENKSTIKHTMKQGEFSFDEKSNASNTKKLEKSFSDSDDEPLAIKLNKPSDHDEMTISEKESETATTSVIPKKFSIIKKNSESIPSKNLEQQQQNNSLTFGVVNEAPQIKEKKLENTVIDNSKSIEKSDKNQKTKLKSPSPTKQQQQQSYHHQQQQQQQQHIKQTVVNHQQIDISPPKPPSLPPPTLSSPSTSAAASGFPLLDRYPSPKVNPSFLTPKFDRIMADRQHRIQQQQQQQPLSVDSNSGQGISPTSYTPKMNLIAPSSSTTVPNKAVATAAAAMIEISASTPKSSSPNHSATQAQSANKKFESSSAASIANILSANLMPSKEESGKIFGIASVSLAQSSGPDNTKCTLGKCGSIHKPVLGPVVPTEAYLGDQLSSKERRKAKVNMTHEQIQKWLIECSSNPDEIQDDLDDDFDYPLKPMTFPPSPPPPPSFRSGLDEKESTSQSSSSKATKDNIKSGESAWSGKGPSLKATLIMKEESRSSSHNESVKMETSFHDIPGISNSKQSSPQKQQQQQQQSTPEQQQNQKTKTSSPADNSFLSELSTSQNKASKQTATVKNIKTASAENTKKSTLTKPSTQSKTVAITTNTTSSPKNQKAVTNSSPIRAQRNTSQQRQKAASTTSPKKASPMSSPPEQKKPQNSANKNVRRQPVYNTKLPEPASKKKTSTAVPINTNSFSAFSAENETSIYSFDKEDDVPPPVAKPFRRHSRRESHHEDNSQAEKNAAPKTMDDEKTTADKLTTNSKDLSKDVQSNNSISVTLSPEENSKLVKVSLDGVESPSKAPKSSEKANEFSGLGDSDSEGHTFYIPLQGISQTGSADGKSDVIQGVAVKLGREGPEGPNQRVIMHATLVTKAQMGSNTTPIPESMNVHEIVKSLLSSSNNKESSTTSTSITASKSVPIGTVQPRFKSTITTTTDTQQNPSGSGLTRVNSNSSLFSGSNKSKTTSAGPKKLKDDIPIKMCNNTAFPRHDDPSQMVEAPIFRPTEKEFSDPIEFIERITPIAARFGICKIIPPASFKPECRVSDDMRFTAYNQYVHKMLHRWGPSAKELSAIKKYLATQSIAMTHPPWIGGMEVDLPRLYHTVQELGGLKEVIEKKKWARVAEEMCIPKLAQDRVTKLDDIYCKYLLPYDTLSPAERQKLFDEVEADWAKREARARRNADRCVNLESVSNEDDGASSEDEEESEEELDGVSMECIVKGRSMPLNQFFRIARNTMAVWFKNTEPTVSDIEAEFWRHVAVRDSHVCVHSGSIDSSGWGYGFPTPGPKAKGSTCAKHPWNLKVLTNNQGSVLRSLGPVMGVTVPTLHVGMLFSACCWYRDPHGLSWIEYLHTGASKIWYGIPDEQSSNFRSALTALIPTHCQNKTIWLPCDTVMVPPHMLTDRGVSLCRIEQKPGEFVVIFPRAYTSSVSTGYVVSESVYFATSCWLSSAKDDFKDIHDSCEPAMFSLEQLLFAIASDQRVTNDILTQILPMIREVYEKEVAARQQLKAAGCTSTEKLEQNAPATGKSKQKTQKIREEHECDLCRANLYISMVKTDEGNVYCLQHALKNINNGNVPPKQCKLIFTYNIEDIESLIKKLKDRLAQKRPISGNTSNNKKTK